MAITWESLWAGPPPLAPSQADRRRAVLRIGRNTLLLGGPHLIYLVAIYWLRLPWQSIMSQDAWRVAFIAYYLLLGGASLLLIRPFGDWKSLGFRRPISWSSLFIIVAVTLTFHATKWNFHWDRITLMVSMEVVLASLAYTAFYQAYLIPAIESAGYSWGWAVFWCAMISATIRYPINVGGFEYYLFHGLILGVVFAARRNMIEIAGMRILASLILELGRV